MARALSMAKAKEDLQRVHKRSYGDNDVNLYRSLQRRGYYSLRMAKGAGELQSTCPRCQEPPDIRESLFMQSAGDWIQPYMDFLVHLTLPNNRFDAMNIKWKSSKFFMEEGHLFRRDFNQAPFWCIRAKEGTRVLQAFKQKIVVNIKGDHALSTYSRFRVLLAHNKS